jgi:deoxyribonuclease-1
MLFDLHNLVPSIGQINALRSDDRNADLSNDTSDFGGCAIEDASGEFEPPDSHTGSHSNRSRAGTATRQTCHESAH